MAKSSDDGGGCGWWQLGQSPLFATHYLYFVFFPRRKRCLVYVRVTVCPVHHICQAPLKLGVSSEYISGHQASQVGGQRFWRLLKGEAAHLSFPACSFLVPGFQRWWQVSSSHLDPRGTRWSEGDSARMKLGSWFTLCLFTRAAFRWENVSVICFVCLFFSFY